MGHITENPAGAPTPGGVGIDTLSRAAENYSPPNTAASRSWTSSTKFPRLVRALVGDGPEPRVFKGRFAWMLQTLVEAGDRGVTSLENPAPRISHYVFVLRKEGVSIESVEERHSGPYAGRHVRYRLGCRVEILETQEARP